MGSIDKKGVAIFLIISIGISWVCEGVLALLPPDRSVGGLRTACVLVALLMTPAFAALVASIVRGDTEHPKLNIWPIPKYPALGLAVLAPLLFAIAHTVTTLAGWSTPDWRVRGLHLSQYTVDPSFFLVTGFVLTVLAGPTIFAAVCAGAEFGWRAYLLPKLLPLGRIPAHLLVGLFTAIWALPFTADPFGDPKTTAEQFLYVLAIVGAVSAFLDELWLRTRHTGITAVGAGCFVCQATGMWQYLFPHARLPYAGTEGVVSILVWGIAALVLSRLPIAPAPASPDAAPVAVPPQPVDD